jgi:hypothetical protein
MIINDVPQIVKEKKLTFFAFLTFLADCGCSEDGLFF